MKGFFRRRCAYHELACINMTLVLIAVCVTVLFAAITAIVCVDGDMMEEISLPRCSFSPFFLVLFWLVAYAVYATAFAAALSTPCRRAGVKTARLILLFLCTLVLCYVWIPVVCRAASFLLGTLLCAVILICLALLFSACACINRIAAWGIFAFALWMLYILYDTFALFLLN